MITPRQLAAMMEAYKDVELRADFRAGVLASVQANCWRDPKARPFSPRDFFPGLPEPEPSETPPHVLVAMMEAFTKACNSPTTDKAN